MNLREIIATTVRVRNGCKPDRQRLGEHAIRKALIAAERAKERRPDDINHLIDAIDQSLTAQERAKVHLGPTDPDWISTYMDYAA